MESKIKKLLTSLKNKKLKELDSISDKINIASKYIYLIQRSKSKIEEIKYSNVNLLVNRELKNKILLYQDSDIVALKNAENKYNLVHEELMKYFSINLISNHLSLEQIETDRQFFSLVYQKYNLNLGMNRIYHSLLEEQYEIKKMIVSEIKNNPAK